MKGRLCIPIHDERGRLVAYAGRWVGPEAELPEGEDKYKLPPGFQKSRILFNLHRIVDVDPRTGALEGPAHLFLVEGYFSVFRFRAAGVPAAALMGSSMADEQIELLRRWRDLDRITLLLDGDEAGRAARESILPCLCAWFYVRAPELPKGSSPHDLSDEEIFPLVSDAVIWPPSPAPGPSAGGASCPSLAALERTGSTASLSRGGDQAGGVVRGIGVPAHPRRHDPSHGGHRQPREASRARCPWRPGDGHHDLNPPTFRQGKALLLVGPSLQALHLLLGERGRQVRLVLALEPQPVEADHHRLLAGAEEPADLGRDRGWLAVLVHQHLLDLADLLAGVAQQVHVLQFRGRPVEARHHHLARGFAQDGGAGLLRLRRAGDGQERRRDGG
jgi:hypothetical protein